MRYAIGLAAGVLTLAISMAASAQDFKLQVDLFGQKKTAPAQPKVDWNRRPPADPAPATQPSVVCGMTLVPADPRVDPKMRVATPENGVTFTMRSVQPTICKP